MGVVNETVEDGVGEGWVSDGLVPMFDGQLACDEALLHKSTDGQGSPFPRQTHPTASVTGMPSAVKPFRTATRTWNSAT